MARDAFLMRIDPKIMAAIRQWSEDDLRSVNAQIEFLLRRALSEAGRLPSVVAPPPSDEVSQAEPKKARK